MSFLEIILVLSASSYISFTLWAAAITTPFSLRLWHMMPIFTLTAQIPSWLWKAKSNRSTYRSTKSSSEMFMCQIWANWRGTLYSKWEDIDLFRGWFVFFHWGSRKSCLRLDMRYTRKSNIILCPMLLSICARNDCLLSPSLSENWAFQ